MKSTPAASEATAEFRTLRKVIARARDTLSANVWDYIEGGASGEQGIAANTRVFNDWYFQPRMLAGLTRPPDLTTRLWDLDMSMPVFVSPFGFDRAVHPRGYAAVAEAIGTAGVTSILSESSSDSLEALAPQFRGRQGYLQVSLIGGEDHILAFAQRAKDAGYRGICFHDHTATAWRERALESGTALLGPFGMGNWGPGGADISLFRQYPRWTWERFVALTESLGLPWMLKGTNTAVDARRCVDAGASTVYVSTYGGRGLDGMVPSLVALPDVVHAVGGDVPIVIDSGVRRGTDIAKALALGADAVGIGRVAAWALAAGSDDDPSKGVRAALRLIREELTSVLGGLGCASIAEIERDMVRFLPKNGWGVGRTEAPLPSSTGANEPG